MDPQKKHVSQIKSIIEIPSKGIYTTQADILQMKFD